jgi:hypothetical protein
MRPKVERQKSRSKSATAMNRPVHLAGATLGKRAHVCAFFINRDDEYRVLLPFIKEGLERAEKSVHTVDPQRRSEHIRRLASAGIDVETALQNGQLDLRDWKSTHLRNGQCDLSATLDLFQKIGKDAKREGFPLLRFVTHMEWALEADMNVNDLLEYEAKANDVWIRQSGRVNLVVCTYDLARFAGDVIADVVRTHPMVIVGGILQENPFFVPPDEFLDQLRHRIPTKLKRVS